MIALCTHSTGTLQHQYIGKRLSSGVSLHRHHRSVDKVERIHQKVRSFSSKVFMSGIGDCYGPIICSIVSLYTVHDVVCQNPLGQIKAFYKASYDKNWYTCSQWLQEVHCFQGQSQMYMYIGKFSGHKNKIATVMIKLKNQT